MFGEDALQAGKHKNGNKPVTVKSPAEASTPAGQYQKGGNLCQSRAISPALPLIVTAPAA